MSRNLLNRITLGPALLVGAAGLCLMFVGGVLFMASEEFKRMVDETFA